MNLTIHLDESDERPPLSDIATITVDTPDGEVKTFRATGDEELRRLLGALGDMLFVYHRQPYSEIAQLAYLHGLLDMNAETGATPTSMALSALRRAFRDQSESTDSVTIGTLLNAMLNEVEFARYCINTKLEPNMPPDTKRRETEFLKAVISRLIDEVGQDHDSASSESAS